MPTLLGGATDPYPTLAAGETDRAPTPRQCSACGRTDLACHHVRGGTLSSRLPAPSHHLSCCSPQLCGHHRIAP